MGDASPGRALFKEKGKMGDMPENAEESCVDSSHFRFSAESAYGHYSYDPQQPLFFILCRFKRTVLPALLCNYNCWWVLTVYCITLLIDGQKDISLPSLNITSLAIPVTFVSFLVTFFTQNAWNKYWTCYELTQHLRGQIHDFVVYNASYVGVGQVTHESWELTRLMALMHHRFYKHVADEDVSQDDFSLEAAQNVKLPFKPPKGSEHEYLCTPEEAAALAQVSSGTQYLVVEKWIMLACRKALYAKEEYQSRPFHLERLEMKLQVCREDMGRVITQVSKPIPLQYFHLVLFTVFITTTIYAYGAALLDGTLSWIPLLGYTWGVCGVLEVSRSLMLPFGMDDVDLPAKIYFDQALISSFEVLMERGAEVEPSTTAHDKNDGTASYSSVGSGSGSGSGQSEHEPLLSSAANSPGFSKSRGSQCGSPP